MVYSLVSNEPTVVMNVSREIFSNYHVSSTEAEPGGHQFKEVETTVTQWMIMHSTDQWMIMHSTDIYHLHTDKLVP